MQPRNLPTCYCPEPNPLIAYQTILEIEEAAKVGLLAGASASVT
jgi:hypothetical protein